MTAIPPRHMEAAMPDHSRSIASRPAHLDEPLGDEVPISTTDLTWHLLRVVSGREGAVRDEIGLLRLATYSPIRLTWRQARRRHWRKGGSVYEPVERPLFPGYLFAGAFPGDPVDWHAVRETKGMIEPVTTAAGDLSVIPGAVIRSLILREVRGEFRDQAPDAPMPSRGDGLPAFEVGDRVAVGRTEYVDTVMSIEGIYAALAQSGLKVHLGSLRRAG